MREVSLLKGLLGVEKVVIERGELDEDAEVVVARMCDPGRVSGDVAGCVADVAPAMTRARAGGVGGAGSGKDPRVRSGGLPAGALP